MKKILVVCVALLVLGTGAFAMNENVVVWEQIYQQADSDQQRLSVLLKIIDLKDSEFAPVLQKALDELVTRRLESGTTEEQFNKNRLASLLVQELGNLKSIESAESVYNLYNEVTEPVLKGEAAVALGKMRATDYAEKLAFDLASINLQPDPAASRNQEIVALALVQSLNAMRSPLGYEPVFLASMGWYSAASMVRQTAEAALVTMVDDPTDSILKILTDNPSLEIKLKALEASFASKASSDQKIKVASQTLQIAIDRTASDVATRMAVSNLRVSAMAALSQLHDHSAGNVPLLVNIIKLDKRDDISLDETLNAYVALGVNGTDDAAKFLAAKMEDFNVRQKSGLNSVRDKQIIRQVIASMVLTKNPAVKNVLLQSQFVNEYDAGILNDIKAALATFP